MKKLDSIGSVLIKDQLCPQYTDGTPDTEAGVHLGDIYLCDLDGISVEDKAVLEDAMKAYWPDAMKAYLAKVKLLEEWPAPRAQ